MSESTTDVTTALSAATPEGQVTDGEQPIADPNAKPEGDAVGDPPKGEGEEGAKGEGEAKEGEEGEGDKPAGPPEVYEFKAPEGVELSDEDRDAHAALCKELGLSQETAQALLEKRIASKQAAEQEALAEVTNVHQAWKDAQVADKEFGGKALKENIGIAVQALSKFGTPELVTLLNDSRFGDHPEIIRLLYRVGKAMAEDKFNAPAGEPAGPKSGPRALYPHLPSAASG